MMLVIVNERGRKTGFFFFLVPSLRWEGKGGMPF